MIREESFDKVQELSALVPTYVYTVRAAFLPYAVVKWDDATEEVVQEGSILQIRSRHMRQPTTTRPTVTLFV